MLNIPETVKALFKLDACRKNFRVHFPNGEMNDLTNADVVEESVEFSESICSQSTFKFGLSESSTIEFETVGVGNMLGMTIDCGIEIDLSSLTAAQLADIAAGTWDGEYVALADSDLGYAFFHVPYGRFIVKQCPRDHQAMTHRKVDAYSDTKFLTTPYQEKLLSAKSIESNYTPSFINMMNAILAQDDEQVLINEGYTKTTVGAFSTARASSFTHWSRYAFDAPSGAVKPYIWLRLIEEARSLKIGTGTNAIDPTKIYGITKIEGVKSGDAFDSVSQKLIDDYGLSDSQAHDLNMYYDYFYSGTNKYYATLARPKFIGFATTDHEQYLVNQYLDLTDYNGFLCLYADREGVDSIVTVLSKVTVDVYYSDSNASHPDVSDDHDTFEVSVDGLGRSYFYRYTMPSELSSNDFELELSPSSTFKETELVTGNVYTLNTFSDSVDISKTLSDYLEVCAMFASPNRNGGYRRFNLSDTASETLPPENYSEFWWDEFDVEPIGKIKYKISDGNKDMDITYDFIDGNSTYDMSDNEILKQSKKTRAQAKTFLDNFFIPNIDSVAFTPIEITIGNGLPYLEAGDCIEATSYDNVTAKSYLLEQRITGIQHLTQTAESHGGDLMNANED